MFDNVGGKIKSVAKAITYIGISFSTILGLIVMFSNGNTPVPGLLIFVIGYLASWLSSLTLYGFGQLIENSDILVEQGKTRLEKTNDTYAYSDTSEHKWRCNNCGNIISEEPCPICNHDKKETV